MALLDWDTYLTPKENVQDHRRRTSAAFVNQRSRISQVYKQFSPESVACLGSGYLNDIPVEEIVQGGSRLLLVDWMKNVSRVSFNSDVVTPRRNRYHCLVCDAGCEPQNYCPNFSALPDKPHPKKKGFCSNFKLAKENQPLCENFEPGSSLEFLNADVTEGRADNFAHRVLDVIVKAKNPKAAFKQALKEARSSYRFSKALTVEDDSMDLVTSSMIVSQFDFEPYEFMAKNLVAKFGIDAVARREDELIPLMEELRNNLFFSLLRGHCREINRILQSEGRAYFSLEAFHRKTHDSQWFEVIIFPKVMESASRVFLVRF